jgi:hypothetical protein
MITESLKGKIIKLYKKKSVRGIIIPMFKVKLDDGKIIDVGRGMLSVESFGDDYMSKSANEMQEFDKQPHYGLKKGQTIYISMQDNWD